MKVLVVVWIIWILLWSSTGCSVFLGLRILAPSFCCWIGWVGSYRVRRSLVALNLEGEWRKGFWWIASEESGFVSFPVSFFAIHPGTVVDVRLYRFYKLKVYFTGGEKRRLRDGGGTRNKNLLTLSYYPDLATYSCIINKFNPNKHFIPCTSLHWIVLACRAEYNSTRSVKKYVQEWNPKSSQTRGKILFHHSCILCHHTPLQFLQLMHFFSGFSVGCCINREKGYLLPTWVRKITCWRFD